MDLEIIELWSLFKKWSETESGTLELSSDGSGGIRMTLWQGDQESTALAVSWDSLSGGVSELTEQLDRGCPAAHEFRMRYDAEYRRRHEEITQRFRHSGLALLLGSVANTTTNTPTPVT